MHCPAIERNLLDSPMGLQHDRAARRFINTAGFHANEPTFNQVKASNAIVACIFIESRQQFRRRHLLSVNGNGITLFIVDFDIGRCVWGILRGDAARINIFTGFFPWVLQCLAFRRNMQQVGIDREGGFATLVLRDRNLVLLREVDQLGPGVEIPFPPGCNHLDIRVQSIIAKFETNLVVSFARRAMCDRIGSDFLCNLDLPF